MSFYRTGKCSDSSHVYGFQGRAFRCWNLELDEGETNMVQDWRALLFPIKVVVGNKVESEGVFENNRRSKHS